MQIEEIKTLNDANLFHLMANTAADHVTREEAAYELYRRGSSMYVETSEFLPYRSLCIDRELKSHSEAEIIRNPNRMLHGLGRLFEKSEETRANAEQAVTQAKVLEDRLLKLTSRISDLSVSELSDRLDATQKLIKKLIILIAAVSLLSLVGVIRTCSHPQTSSLHPSAAQVSRSPSPVVKSPSAGR